MVREKTKEPEEKGARQIGCNLKAVKVMILDQGILASKGRGSSGSRKEMRGEIMKSREKAAMHMVGNCKRKHLSGDSRVGHTVSAEAEAAFCWLCFLPTLTTRLPQPPHNPS